MNDRLPASIVYCLFLEWMSPEEVWAAVRASGMLRRHALAMSASLKMPGAAVFRAAEGQVLSDACVRWFRERMPPPTTLVLWSTQTTERGDTAYKCNGKFHRDGDLPAFIGHNGTQHWYQHGKPHRDGDRPVIVRHDGAQLWLQNGKMHRDEDRPAFSKGGYAAFDKWYQHGELHRDGDKPAVVDFFRLLWYQHGELHRDGDLPAVRHYGGTREWWTRGKRRDAPTEGEGDADDDTDVRWEDYVAAMRLPAAEQQQSITTAKNNVDQIEDEQTQHGTRRHDANVDEIHDEKKRRVEVVDVVFCTKP